MTGKLDSFSAVPVQIPRRQKPRHHRGFVVDGIVPGPVNGGSPFGVG